jgi:hypothetical protein
VRKCRVLSVAIFLPSAAAIDRTVNTEEVDTVGAAKSSWQILSCWLPPATNLALSFSNDPAALNVPVYLLKRSSTRQGPRSFEELEARLVAGGNQQDKICHEDLAAPTVSTSSVFTVLSTASAEGRKMATLDIGGAFRTAATETGVQVHMRLDRTMTRMLTSIEASYKPFIDVRLDTAYQLLYFSDNG